MKSFFVLFLHPQSWSLSRVQILELSSEFSDLDTNTAKQLRAYLNPSDILPRLDWNFNTKHHYRQELWVYWRNLKTRMKKNNQKWLANIFLNWQFLKLGLVYIMFSDFMYTPILIMTALCCHNRRTVQLCLFLWYYFCGDTIEIPVSIIVIMNFIMLKLMWPYVILGRVYSG